MEFGKVTVVFFCGLVCAFIASVGVIDKIFLRCGVSQMEWGGKYYKCVEVVPEFKEKK